MVPVEMPVTAQNRVKGLIELRECSALIEYQAEDYPESDIGTEQTSESLYDGFTKKYCLINSRGNTWHWTGQRILPHMFT
jgi:hypothetical protein